MKAVELDITLVVAGDDDGFPPSPLALSFPSPSYLSPPDVAACLGDTFSKE